MELGGSEQNSDILWLEDFPQIEETPGIQNRFGEFLLQKQKNNSNLYSLLLAWYCNLVRLVVGGDVSLFFLTCIQPWRPGQFSPQCNFTVVKHCQDSLVHQLSGWVGDISWQDLRSGRWEFFVETVESICLIVSTILQSSRARDELVVIRGTSHHLRHLPSTIIQFVW